MENVVEKITLEEDGVEDIPNNVVWVRRYIRPEPIEGLPDNKYGIAISYIINHDEGAVYAQWSVCNGDQFDRKVGIEIAVNLDRYVKFDFRLVSHFEGLSNALLYVLEHTLLGDEEYRGQKDYLYKHSIFLLARAKLHENGNLIAMLPDSED